jgi:hypothetical protein
MTQHQKQPLPSYGAIPIPEDAAVIDDAERRAGDDRLSSSLNNEEAEHGPFLARFPSLRGALPSLERMPSLQGVVQNIPSSPIFESINIIRHSSFVLTGDDCSHHHHRFVGTATVPSEVANMTKNLIGGGVLSLSGGIAIYSSNPAAIVSAFYLTVMLGAVFGYFCLL